MEATAPVSPLLGYGDSIETIVSLERNVRDVVELLEVVDALSLIDELHQQCSEVRFAEGQSWTTESINLGFFRMESPPEFSFISDPGLLGTVALAL